MKLPEGRNHIFFFFYHSVPCKKDLRKCLLKGKNDCFIVETL